MAREPRYDIHFEEVEISPVTNKNRFYQVAYFHGGGNHDLFGLSQCRTFVVSLGIFPS